MQHTAHSRVRVRAGEGGGVEETQLGVVGHGGTARSVTGRRTLTLLLLIRHRHVTQTDGGAPEIAHLL